MRVIAGKARRLQLKTIDGMGTRPTTDRIKETLFNMINNDMPQAVFLDLFSGSGAIGIEALSRGASKAYFVESNKKAVQCIKDNLNFTKLQDDAVVMAMPVESALKDLEHKVKFDFIFMDPPYGKDYEYDVLLALSHSDIVDRYTIIVIEEALNVPLDYIDECGFETVKIKNYKTNKHIFIRLKESE